MPKPLLATNKRSPQADNFKRFSQVVYGKVFYTFLYHKKAFSLLELVISLGVLVSGITVVMQAFSYSAYIGGLSGDTLAAVRLAEDKLQELEFKENHALLKDVPLNDSGNIDNFQWQYALNFLDSPKLYKLNLDISWKRQNKERAISFNTYLR